MASEQEEVIKPAQWGEFEIRGPVHLFRERLIRRSLRALLPPGAAVVDAGCGSGSLALDLCASGYKVHAVEKAVEFVERLAAYIEEHALEHLLQIDQGSITALPLATASADGLICGEVLEHILPASGGDQTAVAEFHRVLKVGAPCIASVPLNPQLWDHSDVWAGHVKRYTPDEFITLFQTMGFAVKRVRYWGFPLGRLYHRFFFAPWLQRTAGNTQQNDAALTSQAAKNRYLTAGAAGLLRFDELFSRWPWGRGMVLWARRL